MNNSKPHVHNVNWPKDIRPLQDHLIPNLLSFFHAHNTTVKLPKLAILHNLELDGKKKGGWVDNSISNQSPNKFYQAINL